MKILLINIDSKIPNLALKKIEKYHLDRRDEVLWNNELFYYTVDKAYVSCIFPENRYKCEIFKNALIGGTGWDLKIKLPPEIDCIKPKINWGFTTRGCIRKCYFCFVPEKEGYIHIEGDIYDIWDGKSKEIYLMDNNILALPEHFKIICAQLKKENLRVDFNQGLDHRLLTEELWVELKSLKHLAEIRFAYDDVNYINSVTRALDLMKANGLKNWETRWYVYVGEKDTFKSVYDRLQFLRSRKQKAYVMRDRKIAHNPIFMGLSCWANEASAFQFELKELLDKSNRMKSYRKLLLDELS